jgi:hypothetical protein
MECLEWTAQEWLELIFPWPKFFFDFGEVSVIAKFPGDLDPS